MDTDALWYVHLTPSKTMLLAWTEGAFPMHALLHISDLAATERGLAYVEPHWY